MIDEITTKCFKIGLFIPKIWNIRDIFHCTFVPFSESNEVTFKSRMRVPLQIVMVYQNTILGFIKLAFVYEWMAFSNFE